MSNKMTRNTLSAAILAALSFTNLSSAAANQPRQGLAVEVNGKYLVQFEDAVRLSDVLQQANQALDYPEVYWPAVQLGLDNDTQFEQFKSTVLAQLSESTDPILTNTAAQLSSLEFISQPFHHIDIAKARQDIAFNPLLPAGEYTLTMPTRPDSIYIFGGVERAHRVAFQTATPVSAYIRALHGEGLLHKDVNKDRVYLIRDGQVTTVDWSIHNAEGTEAQPGDIIFIASDPGLLAHTLPIETETIRHARELNEHISKLLGQVKELPQIPLTVVEIETPSSRHWSRYQSQLSRNHYGGTGLLQTPTARMADVGTVSLTYSDMDEYKRYSVGLQVFSWLEATAFYARIPDLKYSDVPSFSGDNIYTDKGFDLKARLWKESYWIPEVAVGLRDLAGTGLFDGEYIVANKQLGVFDFSLGLGFGRLGSRDNISNPFCKISDTFCERDDGFSRGGGQFEYDQWFRGPAALFGGVQWQSPWEPLTVTLEYDGNDYSQEIEGVDIAGSSPWNLGFNYRALDWLDLQASYERGDTVMFSATIHTNLNRLGQHSVEPARVEPRATPEVQSIDEVEWAEVSSKLYSSYSMGVSKVAGDDEAVQVYMSPRRFRNPNERIDRAARILADELPESVKEYEFIQYHFSQPMVSTKVDADAFKARVWHEDFGQSPEDTADLFVRELPVPAMDIQEVDTLYDPDWSRHYSGYGIKPFFNQDFGSPEDFHIYQLGVNPFGRYWFGTNIEVFGELGINIANNYDKFNFLDDHSGGLPPVRTNVRNYVQNDVWLDRLQATYYDKFSDNIYGMVYGGYLERMYAGVGAEFLYRPVDANWAIGFDINRVRQRAYSGWGGMRDYKATTGFVSLYYQMPWLEDSMLQLDVGQFLAEDRGVNVTFQKRFESGVTVGAYAAFTDVSQEDYGEGSFTKGFFMSIPFDLIGVRPTRQRVGMHWIPLARNGGRKLLRRSELWGITDDLGPFYHR